MIKVKVPPKNGQLVIHTVVTLLASAVDLIDGVAHFATHSRDNDQHASKQHHS
ncbi:hypothetical protein RJJ65_37455 [Rhizobium hidalgonense]|uniref:Uncharacterized protein n=1 Tax=Rhizobium hidalgonense TaxID=1538159 RepID=A0AAJ2H5Y8_9HYPH|nr:hypothetical protein [Rhizobium hidalgonense]MDR9778228.1 hypothetical protein [Rhizobium hidalgonense]